MKTCGSRAFFMTINFRSYLNQLKKYLNKTFKKRNKSEQI